MAADPTKSWRLFLPPEVGQVNGKRMNWEALVDRILGEAPTLASQSLASQWSALKGDMREFVKGCKLVPLDGSTEAVSIKLGGQLPPLAQVMGRTVVFDRGTQYRIGSHFALDGWYIRQVLRRTYFGRMDLGDPPFDVVLPADRPPGNAFVNPADYLRSTQMTAPQGSGSCGACPPPSVNGPVYVVADHRQQNLPSGEGNRPFFCISIPGLDFMSTNGADYRNYFDGDRDVPNDRGQGRMRLIWHHILSVCSHEGLQMPVLCGIGCGAFAMDDGVTWTDRTTTIRRAWGEALVWCLETQTYPSVQAVFCSLPVFPGEERKTSTFELWESVFRAKTRALKLPVVLCSRHGLLEIARTLRQWDRVPAIRTGILNPSDALAVRQGHMGMYWPGGHIALEELLAVQTTLLLHGRLLNPTLWAQPRVLPVEPPHNGPWRRPTCLPRTPLRLAPAPPPPPEPIAISSDDDPPPAAPAPRPKRRRTGGGKRKHKPEDALRGPSCFCKKGLSRKECIAMPICGFKRYWGCYEKKPENDVERRMRTRMHNRACKSLGIKPRADPPAGR